MRWPLTDRQAKFEGIAHLADPIWAELYDDDWDFYAYDGNCLDGLDWVTLDRWHEGEWDQGPLKVSLLEALK